MTDQRVVRPAMVGLVPFEVHFNSLRNNLDAACKAHRAETGQDSLWPFTVDAVIYLVEWLGLSEPKLSHDFLHALADHAGATTREQRDASEARVVVTSIELFAALTAPNNRRKAS